MRSASGRAAGRASLAWFRPRYPPTCGCVGRRLKELRCPWLSSAMSSVGGPAAIDRQRRAGDRGGGVGAKEQCERSQFLHRGEPFVGLLGQQDVVDDLLVRDAVRLRLIFDLLLD